MKPTVPSEKRGVALIIVMAVLVATTLLAAALLQLSWFNERETIHELRQTQAHWLAEAGLERGLSRVMASKDYRSTLGAIPTVFSNDETLLGGIGSYSVAITREATANPLVDLYTITSEGSVTNGSIGATGTVRVRMQGAPGGQQALMGLDGSTSKIAANTTVDGTIYQDGQLQIANGNQNLLDIIEATDGIYGNTGAATEGDLPDPIPGPRIKSNELAAYSNMWLYASSTNAGGYAGGAINLGGGTNYYRANTVTLDAAITGPGTIVVSSNLLVKTTVPANVNLIAGGIMEFNKATAGGNNTFFTFKDIDLTKVSFTDSFVSMLAMGGILINANINTFEGIFYADGTYRDAAQDKNYYGVIFKSGNQTIRGTIIAWDGFYIGSNATITYDPSVFADPNPVNYGNSLAIQVGTWQWDESPLSNP